MALYLVIQVGAVLSRYIPRPCRYLIGIAVGDGVFTLWRSKRRILLCNMATVLGKAVTDRDVRRIARKSMRNYCKYLIEFLDLPNLSVDDERIRDLDIRGLHHLQEGIERGTGVLLASAHFGTIEVGGVRLGEITDFHAVYDSFKPAYLDRLIRRKRLEKGIKLIPVTNVRDMLRVLRQGGTIAMLFDRPMPIERGVPVRFFGALTAVPAGPATIALKTDATLLPVFMFRNRDNTFRAEIYPRIVCAPTGDREADVQRVTQKLMDAVESVVRREPDQWYMFRSMWPESAQRTGAMQGQTDGSKS